MADNVKIEIVSPERHILSAQADAVSVPGMDGYFTVMGDHAPLMTTLKPGFVTVTESGTPKTFFVKGGFADVSPEGLTILAEEAKTSADFDKSEIEAAITEAQTALDKAETPEAKSQAQSTLDGWKNLLMEAATVGTTH